MEYTTSQQRAINTIDRNLQIIACAGSGKTQVISQRIINILKTKKPDGIGPADIVAFTFTEKAAGELKDRIQKLAIADLGTDEGLAEMYVGTIHGYCLNLLQQPPMYDFLKYSVLTEVQQRLLIDRKSTKSGLTEVPLLRGGTLSRWKDSQLYQTLLGILEEGGVNEQRIPVGVCQAAAKYREVLDGKKYLDYSGMLNRAVNELKSNPKLREKLKSSVKYLVVDEYQDVNPLQESLIHEIVGLGANICVVGDDDQTIYQWRGSDVQNILSFAQRYSKVETVALNENYRSTKEIVFTARRIAEQNPSRLKKEMESAGVQSFEKGDILAIQFTDNIDEALWIAKKIKWMQGVRYQDHQSGNPRGLTYSDMAILVRAWKDAGPIADALRDHDIPYIGGGMNSLLDTPEAQATREAFYFLADHAPRGRSPVTEASLRISLAKGFPVLNDADIRKGVEFLRGIHERIQKGPDNQLFLQRVFLDLLEAMSLREERIGRKQHSGEIIFFNLGKFSRLISDFEHIHFHSSPASIYSAFASFLEHQAANYYPETSEEEAHAQPEAVRIMTVHQAKGMQWPVVFIPCLRANRFPSSRHGGRSIWHVIPEEAVPNADRYKGTVEDERRLFYVALTRAEKYLFCSWGPVPGNQQHKRVSEFFTKITQNEFVLGRDPNTEPPRLNPQPRVPNSPLPLTFSELRYFFQCPYQFKLRFLYGFNEPVSRALGYGKSLHDALCEIHAESIQGRVPTISDVPGLVERHLHLPFANDEVKQNSIRGAERILRQYLELHTADLARLEYAEKPIELKLADGIVVSGRVDLIRHTDTNEITIVDFKSGDKTQPTEMTRMQLQVYAAGYQKLTGRNADLIEINNLDQGLIHRETINETMVRKTLDDVVGAGASIRAVKLPKHERWCGACDSCTMSSICRIKPAQRQSAPPVFG